MGKSKSSSSSNTTTTNNEITTDLSDYRVAEDEGIIGGNINLDLDNGSEANVSMIDLGAVDKAGQFGHQALVVNGEIAQASIKQNIDLVSDVHEENTELVETLNKESLKYAENIFSDSTKAIQDTNKRSLDFADDALDTVNDSLKLAKDSFDDGLSAVESITGETMDFMNENAEGLIHMSDNAMQSISSAHGTANEKVTQALEFAQNSTRSEASQALMQVSDNMLKAGYAVSAIAAIYLFSKRGK